MPNATGEFQVAGWDEQAYEEGEDGAKLTRAIVTLTFSGGVTGDARVDWLMAYNADGSATFVGLQRVTGALDGKHGRFVVETNGRFADGEARGSWRVIEGSATSGLRGLEGEGEFRAPMGGTPTYSLEYKLP